MNENDQDEAYLELELELSIDDGQTLVRLLDEGGVLPGLSGYYEVLYQENRPATDRTVLMLYFPVFERAASANLELLLSAIGSRGHIIRENSVLKKDYLEAYKEHYTPFRISERFVIIPSWDKNSDREKEILTDKDIPLYLDPGLAFGTGKHPTTDLCLNYIDTNSFPGMRMIDAGCGSGILAIGAVLAGAGTVFAFDVDGNAINAVKGNMELNSIEQSRITVEIGGFELESFKNFEADLFVGNLTQNIIFSAIDKINNGNYNKMVLSGILTEKKGEVIDAFSDRWNMLSFEDSEGWTLIELERKP